MRYITQTYERGLRTGITIVQTLLRLQGYALHVPDQVIFRERHTSPHHNTLSLQALHVVYVTLIRF